MGISFFGSSAGGGGGGIRKVADAAARAALAPTEGDFVIQLDTDDLYYYNGSAWELYVEDADNDDIALVISNLAAHLADTTDAHLASAIGFTPTGSIAATTAQAAIAEVATDAAADLAAHIADTTDAHAASAIGFTPTGNIAATTVQAAIAEVDSETDTRLDALEATSHAAVTLTTIGATPNANGASLSTQQLQLQPANASFGGVVSTAAQTFAGAKTFSDTTDATSTSTGAIITSGGIGAAKNIYAGTGLNVGSGALDASQILRVASTTQGANPMPSMTTAQRTAIASPATALMVYDTDLGGAMFYDGTQWQFMDGRATIAAAQTPANAATLTPLGYRHQILPVSGNGGSAVTLADLGVANAKSGDVLTLIGTSDTATVTLVAATNTSMNGSCTLALDSTITFKFYSSKWREVERNT